MKKISHAIVLVEDIHSSLPRTEFSEADLDEAARLLLKIEGVITPPILLESGVDSYKLIDGHFEYYAALRAGEIDPLKGETINAYLVEDEADIAVYKKQIEVFRQQYPSKPVVSTEVNNLEARFAALEKNILHNISELIKALQPAATPTTETPVPETTSVITDSSQEEQKLLEEINTLDIMKLNLKLEQIKTRKNVLENILKARQNPSFQPFTSNRELIKRIKGLGDEIFDQMLDKYMKL
jgi:hypothetical protein